MTGLPLILAFVLAVVLMIVAISKFKVHPFLAIMSVSLILALVAGIPLVDTTNAEGVKTSKALCELAKKLNIDVPVSNAIYEDTKIKFKNKFDDVVAVIDANSFIKDGMVDSVSIVDNAGNKALKIIFNTDSGKDPITIDIGDIFELDDYYTKS